MRPKEDLTVQRLTNGGRKGTMSVKSLKIRTIENEGCA